MCGDRVWGTARVHAFVLGLGRLCRARVCGSARVCAFVPGLGEMRCGAVRHGHATGGDIAAGPRLEVSRGAAFLRAGRVAGGRDASLGGGTRPWGRDA